VTERNELIRQARERLPSRAAPGEPLSREDLADLLNRWLYERRGRTVLLDANYIGKLERGVIRWPQRDYRDALRAVLRVGTDADLGLSGRRQRHTTTVDPVERQQFLRLAASAAAALPWADLFAPTAPTAVPTKVAHPHIEQVRSATATFASWGHTYGGGLAREAVFAQLRWSAQLLNADCPASLRPALFTAVAELGSVTGFMAFDAYAHDDARRTFRFSLQCAEQAPNWHLRARILGMMARQAIWCGQPDTGLTHIETALVRQERLTATERASLHTLRARSLARLGRVSDCLSAVGAADDAFAHSNPSLDPSWMGFYDHAQHQGDTGHALFDLALAGRRTQAAPRLAYAVAHHGEQYARSRTISRTKLASLLMATGDPRKAAAIGQRALDDAGSLRSRRAVDDLWELHRYADRHSGISDVADLRDRIAYTLESA
jgi:hypothetical protein